MTPAEQKEIADLERQHAALPEGALKASTSASLQAARSRIQQRLDAANSEAAGRLLGRAPTDAGAREQIRAMATGNAAQFPAGFAFDMASMEPAAMAAHDAEAEAFDANNRGYVERKGARRAKALQAKKERAEEARMAHAVAQAEGHDRAIVDRIDSDAARARDRQVDRDFKATDRAVQARLRNGQADDIQAKMADFNQRNNSGLSDVQIHRAVENAVNMVNEGVNVNQAMIESFNAQIAKMQALYAKLQAQADYAQALAARMSGMWTGPDQSGNFSQMSPMWGGG